MFTGTEDEDLFDPAASSNLAALFGATMTLKNNDTSLSYTAPKQPKVEKQEVTISPKRSPQSSVLISKFVNVFKQVDGKYVDQGKCGIAIIGIETLNAYELILYKSKQDIISRSKLNVDFRFKIQTNNFANFSDDRQEHWSVHFDNGDLDIFTTHLETYNVHITQPVVDKPESESDTSTTKASILTRMAKMGQSILPSSPKTADSESDDTNTILKRTKRKSKHVSANVEHTSDVALVNSHPLPQQAVANQFLQVSQTPDMFNIFLAENRTHNCEMRMNMLQLSNKLDKIMEGVVNGRPLQSQIDRMDPRYVELFNEHEQCKLTLRENLDEIDRLKKENSDCRETIVRQELKMRALEDTTKVHQNLVETIEKQMLTIKSLESEQSVKQAEIQNLTELTKKLTDNLEESRGKLSNYVAQHDLFSTKLKHNMNMLYRTLMDAFKEGDTFSAPQIQQILATNLRTSTVTICKEFCNNFDITESDS
uniref:Uncharacterized protein n=1 Tax=Photinus pyralis TaxID=7054 RepID=A0A1Y1NBX1_PHOPY